MKTLTKIINSQRFIAKTDATLEFQAQRLLTHISQVNSYKLRDKFAIRMGWSNYILSEQRDGFHILVPDYKRIPFKHTSEDLTIALWVQWEQESLLRKLGVEGEAAFFTDQIIAAKGALEQDEIWLEKKINTEKAPYWVIGSRHCDAQETHSFFAYELLKKRPYLLQILPLPVGSIVQIEGENIASITL
ncbi:hypothetical protein LRR81_17180 [Metabacillus sp. GX 13764]|uniref:immunity protein Imm33 domain-containing protein n=1 Tax=Metabacillus kandeliae TaxID=2900151 RepID=UPI001E480B61|nr:hypothetical protein [Metabacillus kandeliae]MCD7035980.1 hypothetical protein [Metabacillus kandeliae]